MCGIVGYIGGKTSLKSVVDKLKLLEYRGYDSAGIYAKNAKKELLIKSVGNISKLEGVLPDDFDVNIAIAHTRWATHGQPSENNCHPHASKNNEWIIVHNGIIENYLDIKDKLNFKPNSETDTAVLSQFLEERNVDNIEKFIDIFNEVEGSYSVAAVKRGQDKLFLAKQKSPLYVAKTKGGFICASDSSCFSSEVDGFYVFYDDEFAEITNENIQFYDKNKKILQKFIKNNKKIYKNVENKNFSHYMLKEIEEQSIVVQNLVNEYRSKNIFEKFDKNLLKNIENILFLGCGTAYHAALMGVRYFEEIANIKASAEIASEFVYKKPVFVDKNTLVIAVSQSGETADTLKAVDLAKSYGAKLVALTNVEHSTITSRVDIVLPVCAGVEKAVASTKAYVCQLCVLYLMANYFSNGCTKLSNHFVDLENLAKKLFDFDKTEIKNIANKIKNRNDCIFIGKGLDYITATEASLKLKEVSYINSTSYPSGELKHGFLALVEDGTPLFVFALSGEINKKTFNAAAEAEARGAYKIVVTNEDMKEEKNAKMIKINQKNRYLAQIAAIVPMQYLAYNVSILKNINPDQPRNLAKSVTVE